MFLICAFAFECPSIKFQTLWTKMGNKMKAMWDIVLVL